MLTTVDGTEIAIIGMAGRFPGAENVDQFWHNLRDGQECITFFGEAELEALGVSAAERGPDYVAAASQIAGIELFDAAFFGFSPREAEIMDPQHRILLECAWEALEHAGYEPDSYPHPIGAYLGAATNTYLLLNLLSSREVIRSVDPLQINFANTVDYMTTRVSYNLNLRGPGVTVQTACSTSLVAVHLARRSLLDGECDIALAGGVSVNLKQRYGYRYQRGGIYSPDGHCRAFDKDAQGTIFGSGVGIVVLKRLQDALSDGDTIYAIIRGSAINNDGSAKVGYTAPSGNGQTEVIIEALANADIDPATIGYIETHGTGTPLGDPIEIAALSRALRSPAQQPGTIAIGSVKTNMGHLDAAAGVTGLIKTVLALKHRQIPPSLNFSTPNPQLDFANSPLFVNTELRDWPRSDTPRRAGVSSFGIGGTNAHVVLEEAPALPASGPSRPYQLLLLSARTPAALEAARANLTEHLSALPASNLADVAYTLQVGRRAFSQRQFLVCQDLPDAIDGLRTPEAGRLVRGSVPTEPPTPVFMFPGGGAQYPNMALELYTTEPVFRAEIDRCAEILRPMLDRDLRTAIYPPPEQLETATQELRQTQLALPALFAVEYALAQLWISWGVRPAALIGHSLGEYVAATLAGVFSLPDALALVTTRGRLMMQLPAGAMLVVPLSEQQLESELNDELSIAAINTPGLSVVSGPIDALHALHERLAARELTCRWLQIDVAAHSTLVLPILAEFSAFVEQLELHPPQIPYISNVTGSWITAAEATDPRYWAQHLRQTVRWGDGLTTLLAAGRRALLEIGPGTTLSSLARQHPAAAAAPLILPALPHARDQQSATALALMTLGQLWLAGVAIDWRRFSAHEQRRRVPVPTYPFERQRYWIEAGQLADLAAPGPRQLGRQASLDDWFYLPSWKRTAAPARPQSSDWPNPAARLLVFEDQHGLAAQLIERLIEAGQHVLRVSSGAHWQQRPDGSYLLDPADPAGYSALLAALQAQDQLPSHVLHCWSVTGPDDDSQDDSTHFDRQQARGFASLLELARAFSAQRVSSELQWTVLSDGLHLVGDDDPIDPAKATLLGVCKVVAQEYPHITCRSIDLTLPPAGHRLSAMLLDDLLAELARPSDELVVAYRGRQRWVQVFDTLSLPRGDEQRGLRQGGVYLITGGLGQIGLALADSLTSSVQARVVLLGRRALPPAEQWADWLATHPADDPTSVQLRKLQALQHGPGELLVLQADVADQQQLEQALAQTVARFGALHGVIHAAGLTGAQVFSLIQDTAPHQYSAHFRPKVHGVYALARALAGYQLDFCLLCSSISAVLGGLGFVAYAAANAFMDAFAQQQRGAGGWISVNWDGWAFDDSADAAGLLGATLAELTMTPAEGAAVFARAAARPELTQLVISTGDLDSRIAQWVQLESIHGEASSSGAADGQHPRPALTTAYTAGRTQTELALVQVWQQVLGIAQVGVDDSFFELGGHSLLAVQIVSRIRDAFQVELPLRDLFERPTVAAMAGVIDGLRQSEPALQLPPIAPVPHDGPLPLSFAQQRLWFLDQLAPGSSAYNLPTVVAIDGPLDLAVLERSFAAIIERHEALRTVFHDEGGQPYQLIQPAQPVALRILDLAGLPAATRSAAALRLALEDSQQPFDLRHGPLLRVAVLQLEPTHHLLALTMHHIVGDGWSLGVIVRELAALYDAIAEPQPAPLAPLAVQYADYAVWQRQWLAPGSPELERLLRYWKRQLAGLVPLQLPTDRPRPDEQRFEGSRQTLIIPRSLVDALARLSQQEEATLFMTTLAAFKTLLYRYGEQTDIVLGTDVANRNSAPIEALIGFFVNILVLRSDLGGDPPFRALLRRVRQTVIDAYMHQELPFEKLVEELHPERSLSRTPLVQTLFVFQNAPMPPLRLPGVTLTPVEIDDQRAKFDLAVLMHETEQGLVGYWNYNAALFDAATITQMMQRFSALLESIVAAPDARLNDLSIVSSQEKEQQLMEKQSRNQTKFKKFMSVTPQAVNVSPAELVESTQLRPDQPLPLVLQPTVEDVDLVEWTQQHLPQIEQQLAQHGALLFHNFNVRAIPDFERFAQVISPQLFKEYGDLPREKEGDNVYTSTPYPADQAILFHNESAHMDCWPMKQWFFCVTPAAKGGETVIVDCRQVYQALDPEVRAEFARKRLMYVRNYTPGLDVRWQDFFQTDDRAVVERFCRQSDIDFQWKDGDRLKTAKVCPAIVTHPTTGDKLFFNQVQLHHSSSLEPAVRESIRAAFAEDDLPRNVYFGDGTPIPDEVIAHIRDLYWRLAVPIAWQAGDILMVDNMLTAHARKPFEGPRKIVVAMGAMIASKDVY